MMTCALIIAELALTVSILLGLYRLARGPHVLDRVMAFDLITTCASQLSRNHYVGEEIAKGRKLAEITGEMNEVAEGIPTAKAAFDLAQKLHVEVPITEQVYAVLYQNKDPQQAITDLMTRALKEEG